MCVCVCARAKALTTQVSATYGQHHAAACCTSSSFADTLQSRNRTDVASTSFFSPSSSSFSTWNKKRFFSTPLQRQAASPSLSTRKPLLKVKAAVGYPASISWWKKGGQFTNMREITSSHEFLEALSQAALQDKLVLVDFYSIGCRSCKALYPKICQLAAENPNLEILTVNFYDNKALCRSLNVNIMPFFHFYRGSEGRIDAFSCSLSKISKLREAVAKYQGGHHLLSKNITSPCSEQQNGLLVLPTLATVGAAV